MAAALHVHPPNHVNPLPYTTAINPIPPTLV